MRTPGLTPQQVADLTRLRQALRRVELTVMQSAAPAAAEAAAAVLKAAVFREAPKDTGFMAEHIEIIREQTDSGAFVLLVQIGDHDFQGKTYYAAMVEYGTHKMPANPFMRRAIDKDGEAAGRAAEAAFGAALKRGLS